MHLRRLPTLVLGACLVLVTIGAYRSHRTGVVPIAAEPATVTLLYTRGLSGMIEPADLPSASLHASFRTLADVVAVHEGIRGRATDDQKIILMDLGGSLTGLGAVNSFHRGVPMAHAMAAVGYRAVFPSTRDLLPGFPWLQGLADKGRFTLLVGNARPPLTSAPLLVGAGTLRVAVFGLYFPADEEDDEGDHPDQGNLVFSRNLDLFRQGLRTTNADARIVVAHVRDVGRLARRLPEATLVVPAAPPGAPSTRTSRASPSAVGAGKASHPPAAVAPALSGPQVMGRIDIRKGPDGQVEVSLSQLPVPRATSAPERLVRVTASSREKSARVFGTSAAREGARVLACLDDASAPTPGCDTAPLVADLVRQELECDACIISSGDARKRLPTVVSPAALAATIAPAARVQVLEMEGRALQQLLETALAAPNGKASRPALAGLHAWTGSDGGLLLVQHEGQALPSVPRLRVAVSASLITGAASSPSDPSAAERPLGDVVQEALVSRPLLALPPRSWFVVAGDQVPDATALIDQGLALLAAGHGVEAREPWTQALCRKPDEKTLLALLQALQAIDPQAPPSYGDLAALAEAAGCEGERVRALKMGDTAWPTAWVYPLERARADLRRRMPAGVESFLQAARERGAPPEDLDLVDGWRFMMTGKRADAAKVLMRASLARPRSVQARALAGMALFSQGDPRRASHLWSRLGPSARDARERPTAKEAAVVPVPSPSPAAARVTP